MEDALGETGKGDNLVDLVSVWTRGMGVHGADCGGGWDWQKEGRDW